MCPVRRCTLDPASAPVEVSSAPVPIAAGSMRFALASVTMSKNVVFAGVTAPSCTVVVASG